MDASPPARLISSRFLFLCMVPLIVPAGMWREGCPLACCRFCMAAPAFKKERRKNKKNKKSQSPKSIVQRSRTSVRDISVSSLKMTTPLQSLAWRPQKEKIYIFMYITRSAPFNVLFLPFVVSNLLYIIVLPYCSSSSMCTLNVRIRQKITWKSGLGCGFLCQQAYPHLEHPSRQ